MNMLFVIINLHTASPCLATSVQVRDPGSDDFEAASNSHIEVLQLPFAH